MQAVFGGNAKRCVLYSLLLRTELTAISQADACKCSTATT